MLINRFMSADPWRTMDQMLNEVFATPVRRRVGPKVRVRDTGESFELRAPLPGVTEGDVELTVGEDFVTLKAERKAEEREGYTAIRRERVREPFERSYRLPDRVDTSKVEARLDNGVLTVTLPKLAEAKTRTIRVKAA